MVEKVSIVIPAYNEEIAIGNTLDLINSVIKNIKSYEFEIIVVNNNSKDSTKQVAEKHGALVLDELNLGYGNAYKKGMGFATGDIVITGDADASYPFEDIPRFLKLMAENDFDFINTNRFANLEKNSMPVLNYFGNKLLTLMTNGIYGVNIKDSQSGMWIFKKEILENMDFDIMGGGMPFSQEIKIYSKHNNNKFVEIPIKYRKRLGEKKLNPLKDGYDNFINLLNFKKKLK
ncbi:glycosyl transferase family protein [Methanococcus maripaludis X1]|uniref:Glycosyl transferase family protein n=1 Tax=Methanococcus maripaludis X1 TaxID=1053692 RepID=G0H3I8_METMI|nr:glycosyltransferase family 2 protein [Methanococcus maripaludis]AEK19378.1 glycosyl transferase family protein [Methanococcus maripaludis X1]